MPLEIVTIPCLRDNYAFLLRDHASGEVALIDAPEAAPIDAALAERGWRLNHILLTHHHSDHIDGVAALRDAHGATVTGAARDRHRLPALDIAVGEGDNVTIGNATARVLDVPGHTVGHVAFHFADDAAVFTADSLMALGCGRLFEGSPEQMWQSLRKLAALPGETLVHSGHEYTAANARFALSVDGDNPDLRARAVDIGILRAANTPTIPSRLGLERATNPFLRASDPVIRRRLNMTEADDVEVFAEIRRRKDNF